MGDLAAGMTGERRRELYDREQRRRELERMLKTHECAICHGPLVLLCSPEARDWYVACGQDRTHVGFHRVGSMYERWKRGEPLPIYITEHFRKMKGAQPMDTKALVAMSPDQMLARMKNVRFPQDTTRDQRIMLATVAIDYGLDPAMNELTLYEGKPYVTIDGRRRKAQETQQLDGISTRPATKDEREAWNIPPSDYFFFAEVRKKGSAYPFIGQGRVREAETKRSDKEKQAEARGGKIRPIVLDPQGMAAKRAEARALRMAFSIPLPSAEAIGEEATYPDAIDTEARDLPEDEPERQVDEETGEVLEPAASVDNPLPDGSEFRNLGQFFTACHNHFGLLKENVLGRLSVRSAREIGDLKEAWQTILAFQQEPKKEATNGEPAQ
jgi:hypothetical protein